MDPLRGPARPLSSLDASREVRRGVILESACESRRGLLDEGRQSAARGIKRVLGSAAVGSESIASTEFGLPSPLAPGSSNQGGGVGSDEAGY